MPTYSGASSVGAFFPGTISFDWIPEPEVVASELIETANRLEDRSGPLAISRQIAIDDMREHFEGQHDPEGNPWLPWSESYEPRARAQNIGEILQRTMDLQDAATAPGAYPITDDSVFFDTSGLPFYWSWHQEGTGGTDIFRTTHAQTGEDVAFREFGEEGRGKALPPRPFVGISFEAELEIIEVFDQWFDSAIALATSPTGKVFGRHALRGPGGRFISKNA